MDGKRYPVKCKIKDRHVVTAKFDGPDSDDQEKEGLSNKQKAALGIAAVVAAAAIASNANKDEKKTSRRPRGHARWQRRASP